MPRGSSSVWIFSGSSGWSFQNLVAVLMNILEDSTRWRLRSESFTSGGSTRFGLSASALVRRIDISIERVVVATITARNSWLVYFSLAGLLNESTGLPVAL